MADHPDDYEHWPIEVIDGVRWHVSPPDPEGVEGQTRVPCADQPEIGITSAEREWIDDPNATRSWLNPILTFAARLTGRNWFWYFDEASQKRRLWFGDPTRVQGGTR